MRLLIVTLLVAAAAAEWISPCPRPIPGFRNDPDFLPYDTAPVPGDCNKYYKCRSDGEPIEMRCAVNEEYNPLKRSCGAPTGWCGATAPQQSPPVLNGRVDDHLCVGKLNGEKVATNNCNSFVTCEMGVGLLQSCDQGLLFNQTAGYCDWPENVRCQEWVGPLSGAAPSCQGRNGQMIRNPYDCSSFYYCENNNALLYYCALGLNFDASIGTCNWKESVVCNTDELPNQKFTPDCNGREWAYITNPDNCSTYFRCEGTEPMLYTCSEGLLFDPQLLTCNWGPSVQCN